MLLKTKRHLCKTTHNSIIEHKGFLNFYNLAEKHIIYNLTAFIDRLNSSASDQTTTFNRLKQTQINNLLTLPVFSALKENKIFFNASNNLNMDCLMKLHELNISINIGKDLF